ncbi:MAG: T9SS type A sorting domain-containing protein [Candidatus Stahlbacteria bacterium]|nr:T9SS type A sorting domain-containing protein [Candidatus Stahlbacteria bacterium]
MKTIFMLLLSATAKLTTQQPINLSDIEILKSDITGIEFVYTPVVKMEDSELRIQNTITQPEPGKPSIPIKYISIGVPVGAKVAVKVIESITSETTGMYIPPTFGFDQPEEIHPIDKSIYSADTYWPEMIVSIEEQSLYRAQEVLKIRLNPARYNPKQNTLLIHKKIRVRVDFQGGKGEMRGDKIFDPVFKSVLINYEQAKNWRKTREIKPIIYQPGPWYKIELQNEGIYKIGTNQLKNAGMTNIDPTTIKLYNGGSKMVTDSLDTLKEIPINVLPDTSIIFYATSLNGWGKNREGFLNPYTNTNVYWLTYSGNPGRRDSISGDTTPNLETPSYFIDTIHIESDMECPGKSGLAWVWEKMVREKEATSLKKDYTFEVQGVYESIGNIKVAVYGWLSTFKAEQSIAQNLNHNVRIYLNGTICKDTTWKNRGNEDMYPTIIPATCNVLHNGINTLTFEMYRDSLSKDVIFFDYFEIGYKKKYHTQNGNLDFKSTEDEQQFEISGFDTMPVIFETSNPLNPKLIYNVNYENGVTKFKGNSGYYYASTNYKTITLKQESPYSIRNHTGGMDFVIITHPEFLDYAKTLKSHREKQGLQTEVFSCEEIYNNFSWGLRHSPYSIRNFLSFVYNNWDISYCLLLGAGTYAYRDDELIKNRVPPYEEGYKVGEYGYPPTDNRCDDHWYTNQNIAIGRITAATKEEARDVIVEKIIKYEQNPGVWWNRILLIADDEDPDGCTFVNYTEGLAKQIPYECDIFKLYSMNYPYMGSTKPTAQADLRKRWSKGPFMTLFGGHGNLVQLCHEILMYNPIDIDALSNKIKLPVSHFWSCGVGCFERETQNGMADYLQKVKGKGSIGTLASTRATYRSGGEASQMITYMLVNPQRTLGLGVYGINLDFLLETNVNLFADPSTRIPLRTLKPTIDSFPDTLRGGKPLKVSGQVQGAKFAYITVMSSEYSYLHSSHCDYNMRGRMINDQLSEDILFEGLVKLDNGYWEQEFFIPIELDPLLRGGNGKISVFAWNDTACGGEAVKVAITQGSPNPDDSIGPRIELYANGKIINDSGTIVPSEFTLTGVLEDESGINTVHSLALLLQVNTGKITYLADYFQYDLGSGQKGRFNYSLSLEGNNTEDTLTVKASDNLGNITTRKVRVKVVSSKQIEIKEVMNYPNPVRGEHTALIFFLSKSAMVKVKIYTIAGRLIRTLPLENKSQGVNQIYWDTRDELGYRVGNGIYIYKIEATSEGITKDESEAVAKLMILR